MKSVGGILRAEEIQVVRRAIADLPERERTLVFRRHILGQASSCIAAELQITSGAVRSVLQRARTKLARSLGGYGSDC